MAVIAHRFGYKFDKYKINLCGAMSTIEQLPAPIKNPAQPKSLKYEMYYGVSYGAGSVSEDRYNTALTYLLDAQDGLIKEVQYKTLVGHESINQKEP
jgi:hypothetical protein